jgi:hypothetical protein
VVEAAGIERVEADHELADWMGFVEVSVSLSHLVSGYAEQTAFWI